MGRKKQVAGNDKYIETGTTLLANAIDTRGDLSIIKIDDQYYVATTTTMSRVSRFGGLLGDPISVPEILYRVNDGQCHILTSEEVRLLKKAYYIVNEDVPHIQSDMQCLNRLLEEEGSSTDYDGARINPYEIKAFVAESFAKTKLI